MNDASENLAGLVAVRPIVCEQRRSLGALPERKDRDQTVAEFSKSLGGISKCCVVCLLLPSFSSVEPTAINYLYDIR